MKKIILITILFIGILSSVSLNAQNTKVKWVTFEEAVKLNESKPKMIFIDVYAEWCGPCKMMDKNTFGDSSVAEMLNKYFYPVKFNAESTDPVNFGGHTFTYDKQNKVHQLAIAILQGKMAYPSIAYMDGDSQLLTVVPGFQKPDDIKPMLTYFGEGHYKTVTWNDYMAQNATKK